MSDPNEEFQTIVDGITATPAIEPEMVARVWAAKEAASILRGKASAFTGLKDADPMMPLSIITLAEWLITGEVTDFVETYEGDTEDGGESAASD
jgi:hypothetical protein